MTMEAKKKARNEIRFRREDDKGKQILGIEKGWTLEKNKMREFRLRLHGEEFVQPWQDQHKKIQEKKFEENRNNKRNIKIESIKLKIKQKVYKK